MYEIAKCDECIHGGLCLYQKDFEYYNLNYGVKRCDDFKNKNPWISVETRLPNKEECGPYGLGTFLLTIDRWSTVVDELIEDENIIDKFWFGDDRNFFMCEMDNNIDIPGPGYVKVKAWAPLPLPFTKTDKE